MTTTSTPIIVKIDAVMWDVHKTRNPGPSPKWTAVVCVLLAVLFLYNPYVTGPSASGSLNVEHPASHRATVGSSELQHFTAPDGQSGTLTLEVHVDVVKPATHAPQRVLIPAPLAPLLPENLLCASLWFRPPPAA